MTDIVEKLRERPYRLMSETDEECKARRQREREEAADTIATLRAEVERLKIENIQMQAALGYGILAEDERHIIPSNPYKCGTCDASQHLRATNERLRGRLEWAAAQLGANGLAAQAFHARAALAEEQPHDP